MEINVFFPGPVALVTLLWWRVSVACRLFCSVLGDLLLLPLATTPGPAPEEALHRDLEASLSHQRAQGGLRAVPAGSERLLGPSRSPSCYR